LLTSQNVTKSQILFFSLISSFVLKREEFFLGSVINAIVSQAMFLLRDRGLQLIRDIPEEIKSIEVFGDQIRIQQLLAEFLLSIIRYAPSQEWVEIHLSQLSKQMADGFAAIRTEFRYISLFPLLSPHIHNQNYAIRFFWFLILYIKKMNLVWLITNLI